MRDRRSFKAGIGLALLAALMLLPACGSSSNTDGAVSDNSVNTTALEDNAQQPSGAGTDEVNTSADGDTNSSSTISIDPGSNAGSNQNSAATPTPTSAPYVPRPLTPGLASKVIVIDAGHNGGNYSHINDINQLVDAGNGVTKQCDTTGTGSFDGYPEYAFTLSVALELQSTLQAAGAQVVMVRSDSSGWGPCITERARIGNDAHADLAISIHGDGNDAPGARGFHVLVPVATAQNSAMVPTAQRFGSLLRDAFGATGMPVSNYLGSNGIMFRGDLGGLNLSVVPKVFIECGNMHNGEDLTLMRSGEFQRNAANSIATAMANLFG
jgi:N-acetylmuramoyl-L-alanine amidase